jgi:hypothetical protein
MKEALHTTQTFKLTDPELLKKAVTAKVEKLINAHIRKQSADQSVNR